MSEGRVLMSGVRDEIFSRIEELERAGLDIPQITKLMLLLRERGIEIDANAYTIRDATDAILQKFTKDTKNR